MNLTIILPIMNRSYFLNRILLYYTILNFKGMIIILDSSNSKILEENRNIIKRYSDLQIKYFKENGSAFVVQKKIMDSIDTDYVTYTGDDDYFLISGLEKCIEFLEKNREFIGANGRSFNFVCDGDFSEKIKKVYLWKQTCRLENTLYERLKFQIQNYDVPVFSVFRKKAYLRMLDLIPSEKIVKTECPDKSICDEILPAYSLACLGKIYNLNNIQLIRTLHNPKNYQKSFPHNFEKIVKEKNFIISFEYLKRKISSLIQSLELGKINKSLIPLDELFKARVYNLKKSRQKDKILNKILILFNFAKSYVSIRRNSSIQSFINQFDFKDQKNEMELIYKSITRANL